MAVVILLALMACADAFGPEVHFEPRDAGLFLCQPGGGGGVKPSGATAESPEMADYWGAQAVSGSAATGVGTTGLKKWWPLWSPSAQQKTAAAMGNSGSLELLTGKKVTLLRPSQSIGIRASFGPFSTKQTIPARYATAGLENERGSKNKPVWSPSGHYRKAPSVEVTNLPNLDVTSHLVAVAVRRENPVARVLFHIGPHGQHLMNYDSYLNVGQEVPVVPGSSASSSASSSTGGGGEGLVPPTEMCVTLTAFLSERNETVTASCSLSEADGVCLANLVLPYHWWPSVLNLTWGSPPPTAAVTTASTLLAAKWNKTPKRLATLAFAVTQTNRGFCNDNHSPARKTVNKKVTRLVHETQESRRVVQLQSSVAVGSIQLLQDVYPHRILTVSESSPFRLVMPAVPLYPGSQFYIFGLLEPSQSPAPLAILIRIRARSGLKIVDIQPTSSFWQVEWEVNHKHSAALATISKNQSAISGNNRNEELFACLFQVEEDPSYDWTDGGRIIWHWSTRYPESYGAKLPPLPPANLLGQAEAVEDDRRKLISAIQVLKDDIQAVVPIAKTRELMNTAILNGRQVGIPLRIFVVSQSGQVADVTLQSSCTSADDSILKVSPACTLVYVDGSEIRGSSNATIMVKYGSSVGYAHFTVWVPEMPLEIVVQDSALSPILGWKIPSSKEKSEAVCRLRFQQTPLEVITKFFAEDHESGRVTYFVSRKTYVYVTDLVQPFLRVSDPRRLILRGTILEGQQLGQADVQVVSPITSQILGSRCIEMTHERVEIVSISAKLVSGLQFRLQPDTDCEECHLAEVAVSRQLTAKYQEALLDVTVHFSDGTTSELHQIPSQYYNLSIESTNNSVVTYAPSSHQRTHYPRIIAVGEGQGDLLKVRLDTPPACQRPSSTAVTHPLALALAHVQVNFSRSSMALIDETVNESIDPALPAVAHPKLHRAERPRGNARNGGVASSSSNTLLGKKVAPPPEPFNPGSITFSEPASADLDNFIGPAVVGDHSFSLRDDSNQLPTAKGNYYDDVSNPKQYAAVLADLPERSSHAHPSSPMEIAVFILLAVFSIAIFVFVGFCMVFAIRQQKQTRDLDDVTGTTTFPPSRHASAKKAADAQLETSARDWVWLGKSTLDRPSNSPFHEPAPKPKENAPGGGQQPSNPPASENGGKTAANPSHANCNLNRVKETRVMPTMEAPPPSRPTPIDSSTYNKKNIRMIQNPTFNLDKSNRNSSQKHVGVNTNVVPPSGGGVKGMVDDNRINNVTPLPNVTKRLAAHKAANARYKRFGMVDFADNMLNMPEMHLYTNSWLLSGQMDPQRNIQNTEEFTQNLLNANTNGNITNIYENTRELLRQERDTEKESTTNFVSSPVIQASEVDIRRANIIENPRFSSAGADDSPQHHLASTATMTANNNNADILTMDYDQLLAFYHQLKEPIMS